MKYKIIEEKYKELVFNIQEFFKASNDSIHKARNEIKIIDYKDETFAVKAFKVPNIINKIAYSYFRDSKAKKSYENSVRIAQFVPRPIAYIENHNLGLLTTSYFISDNFNYDFTIREPLLQNDFEDKENIFKAFAQFTYELHEKGIYHLDYSPGNILIKKEENKYIFKIVDINRMQFKTLSLDERLKNFSKLWAEDKDLEIIVKEYSSLISKEEKEACKTAIFYSQMHKDKTERKKKLKKIFRGKK